MDCKVEKQTGSDRWLGTGILVSTEGRLTKLNLATVRTPALCIDDHRVFLVLLFDLLLL